MGFETRVLDKVEETQSGFAYFSDGVLYVIDCSFPNSSKIKNDLMEFVTVAMQAKVEGTHLQVSFARVDEPVSWFRRPAPGIQQQGSAS